MRKDGTHTLKELKELDGKIEKLIGELNSIETEYGSDKVALVFAYSRPDVKGKAVFATSLHGNDDALSWTMAKMFEINPDLFLNMLDKIATAHPEMFYVHVATKPKPNGTVS